MWRYYLVPELRIGNRRQPAVVKGFVDPNGLDVPWGAMPWGRDGQFLLGAEVTIAQHLLLSVGKDVTALPIDDSVALSTADQASAKAFCDGIGLPASWISGNENGKGLAKAFQGVALLIQRFNGRTETALLSSLAQPIRSLASSAQFFDLAKDFGLSVGSITPESTVGDALIAWGRQWASQQVLVAGRAL